ncbi:MAG TPA: hypothetical protein VH477_16740 [Bryobacteraceae bacterium]
MPNSATPILDLEKEPPAPRRRWLRFIAALLLGGILGLVPVVIELGNFTGRHWPGFNGLLFFPALYAAIAAHELGHLIAGALVGLDVGGIVIGGLTLWRSGERWNFRFNWRCWLGGMYLPLIRAKNIPIGRLAWMVAGGPLASLVSAAAFLLIWLRVKEAYASAAGSLFWLSLFILVVSVLPLRAGLNRSDGARLWMLLRRPKSARQWMMLLALESDNTRGVRPRDWDAQLCESTFSIRSGMPEYPLSQLLAAYRAWDQGDGPSVLQHLENALANSKKSGLIFRQSLFLEAASASAFFLERPQQARAWLERARKLRRPESVAATEAAIALREKRFADALAHLEKANAFVERRKIDSGLVRFAKEKWAEQEEICRAALNKAA